jgi:hypothetical protein
MTKRYLEEQLGFKVSSKYYSTDVSRKENIIVSTVNKMVGTSKVTLPTLRGSIKALKTRAIKPIVSIFFVDNVKTTYLSHESHLKEPLTAL